MVFSIPSSPPGWQAKFLVCGLRASCLDELEVEPQGEVVVGEQRAETPWWRSAGCWCYSDLLPQVCRERKGCYIRKSQHEVSITEIRERKGGGVRKRRTRERQSVHPGSNSALQLIKATNRVLNGNGLMDLQDIFILKNMEEKQQKRMPKNIRRAYLSGAGRMVW